MMPATAKVTILEYMLLYTLLEVNSKAKYEIYISIVSSIFALSKWNCKAKYK